MRVRRSGERAGRLQVHGSRSRRAAFAAARDKILKIDPRLLKAAMRAGLAALLWRRRRWDEDEGLQISFEADRDASTARAVAAEIAWLDGADEPSWPTFPNEKTIPSGTNRVGVAGQASHDAEDNDPAQADQATIRIDDQAAAKWLRLLNAAPPKSIRWSGEIVETYSEWTESANGSGLAAKAEVDRLSSEWNHEFHVLLAAELFDASDERFDRLVKRVTDLPDKTFPQVAQTVIHAADVIYFNEPARPPARPVELRRRMVARTMALGRWSSDFSPGKMSIDFDIGGLVAKLLLNTHDPFSGTRSYLVPAVADRIDPLLDPLRSLQGGGPTTFVALCTINMLLVAPRARHLDFLVTSIESWIERLPTTTDVWTEAGIGSKVVEWFEAAALEDASIAEPTHPYRGRIDSILDRLVVSGISEAYGLEKRFEQSRTIRNSR